MADLANKIIAEFDLDIMHLYSFYMSDKFYDTENEIMASDHDDAADHGASEYKIYNMEFLNGQKFLFLYDFGDEHRFQIKFLY